MTVIGIVRGKESTDAHLARDGIAYVPIFKADITDPNAIQAAADATAKITRGSLDILIKDAAHGGDDESTFIPAPNLSTEQVQKCFGASSNANLIGVAITTNAFLPLVRKGTTKKIISSSTGMADLDLVTQFSLPFEVATPSARLGRTC